MKRLILMLAVFVLVAAPIIAGIWTLIVPKYEARGEVRVRPVIPRLVFKTEDNGVIPFYESYVNTQVSLIRSLTVLRRVLDQPEVQRTQWYRNPGKTLVQRLTGDAIPPLERLKEGLCVQPRPQTEIIDVSFVDPIAKDAKLTVDAVLQQYRMYIGRQSSDTEDRLYRELTSQYNSLEGEIKAREAVCSQLCKQLGTPAPQELISRRVVHLEETQARLSELRNRVAMLTWQMKETAGASDGSSPVRQSQGKPKYHEDAEWRKLDIAARTIRHEIDADPRDPNDPGALRAQRDLAFAQELLRLREAQLDEQWNDRIRDMAGREEGVVSVERQLALAKMEEQLLCAEFEKQKADFNDLFVRVQSLEREETDLRHKRALYDAVRQRLDQKNIERNVPNAIEVVALAHCPSKPSHDHRILFTAGAIILGLCVAGGTGVLTRRRNNIPAKSDGST